jgi:hypothetical protein
MKNNSNLIFYLPGCYGTFIEWLCNFLENPDTTLPFIQNGSSHLFKGNMFDPKERLFEYLSSNQSYTYSRIHPNLFEQINQNNRFFQNGYFEVLQEDLDFLKTHFNRILVLSSSVDDVLWTENNKLTKIFKHEYITEIYVTYGYSPNVFDHLDKDAITRLKKLIEFEYKAESSAFRKENIMAWGKNSIHDFEIWELRELLSLFWFTQSESQTAAHSKLKINNPDLMHISPADLRDNFESTVSTLADFFNITVAKDAMVKLPEIEKQWRSSQHYMYRDALCNDIVDSIVNDNFLDWSEHSLSIIDEALIQKKLYDQKIGIRCYNLNIFPSNTNDLLKLTENL